MVTTLFRLDVAACAALISHRYAVVIRERNDRGRWTQLERISALGVVIGLYIRSYEESGRNEFRL